MQNRIARILSAIFLLIPLYSSGQKLINSPLARFNLGILEPAGSFRSMGMGGTGTAMRDNNTIYFNNPASYSSIDTNSFIFDFGIDYGINLISDGTKSDYSEDLNFDHIMLGFPVSKNWGIAIGILPVTNGYYNISETVPEGEDGTGAYTAFHGGSGGFTNFFLGTGLNITKKLSVGINMSVLFGSLKRYNEFDFYDYYYTFQTNITQKYQLSGIGFDFGLQYVTPLKNNNFLNAGVAYSTGKNCKTNYESIAFRYNAFSSSDTLAYTNNDSLKAHIPGTLRAGIAFGKKNKFVTSIDYAYTRWSAADFLDSEGYTNNTHTVMVGAEYTPDRLSNYSYLKKIDYRIGGHFGNNYVKWNGNKVNELGVSLGAGIPIKRNYSNISTFYSKINFFADYTRKSISGGSVIHEENYFTFGLSLNLFDIWFLKPKYD